MGAGIKPSARTTRAKNNCISSLFPCTDGEVAQVCAEQELHLSCGDGGDNSSSTLSGEQLVLSEAWLYGNTSTNREQDGYLTHELPPTCTVREYNLQYKMGSFLKYINKE